MAGCQMIPFPKDENNDMPANSLNLAAYNITGIQENEHDYHIDAETKQPPTYCPHCNSSALVGFGRREHMFRDMPMHGRRVGVYVNIRRMQCRTCAKTFSEPLPDVDDPPMSMSINSKGPNGRGHETGHINGIFYRSSYEKTFLEYCYNKNIKIESASTKEFRVAYKDEVESKLRMYYPDFYLPDYDIIIEIKPLSMLDFENNEIKIDTGMRRHSLVLVTEEELEDLDAFFEYLS